MVTVLVGEPLTFEDVARVALDDESVAIASGVEARMAVSRRVVEEGVARGGTLYGITTGFGGLSNVRIRPAESERLQRDVVRSHATAVGPLLPREVVRAMLLLKARTLAFGISGVRFELVERLVEMLNENVHPAVPSQGSLGASGDLALLAHLALPLMGEGEVDDRGEIVPAGERLRSLGWRPIGLSFKEGLSLVNGTEAMLALGALTSWRAAMLALAADIVGAMALEASLGTDRAFDESLVALRHNLGPRVVAANLRKLLERSEIVRSHRHSEHLVQDAYSLRCIPQVHGAYRDGLSYVEATLRAELGSAIDNPTVLPSGEVISGGNFHGEALGLALDHLTLCLTGFATISERRTARLVDADLNNGLPAFLTPDPGLRSGFMLAHYTAASLASENRSLCFPASSDSIPTSAGQEDHVSMGMTAARRAAAALANTQRVIAIEALAASQALELRAPLTPSPATSAVLRVVRRHSPMLDEDRPLASDIETIRGLISSGALVTAAKERVPSLQ